MQRLHHETPPAVLIRALNNLYSSEHIGLITHIQGANLPRNLLHEVWAESEAERFANLARKRYDLLTGAEKVAWQRVDSDQRYWKACEPTGERTLNLRALEEDWPTIKAGLAPDASED